MLRVPVVQMAAPLKGQKPTAGTNPIGSLRNMAECLDQVPGHQIVGGAVRELIDVALDQDTSLVDRICAALGSDRKVSEIVSDEMISGLRTEISKCFTANGHPLPQLPASNVASYTGLQGRLLDSWSSWASDPAHCAASWLRLGAPPGVSVDFELNGLLEPVGPENALSVEELSADYDSFANYSGVESDPLAVAIIDGHVAKGRFKEFDNLDDLKKFVGGDPIPNKFACIRKSRPDGSTKRRIIMDSKQSRVTEASRKQFRQVLPRQTDLITDILGLQAGCFAAESVELFVQDAEDAYWQVPLNPRERKNYCCILRMPDGKIRYVV